MKAAAVALVCVLRFAVTAQAAEPVRAQAPAPPPALQPWVDPGSAQPVGERQPPADTPAVAPTAAKAEAPTPHGAVPRQDETARRQCLSAVETRQTVAARRLTEPFRALRAGRQQGDALRAKLCKWKRDQFIYEVFVLRHDGRIVRLYMNAQNGESVGALDDDRH